MNRFIKVFKKFPRTFWTANTMELFERWAWYGIFAVLALYLTHDKASGALGFSQTEKGIIMGTGTFLLYLLPVITGALADRYGYKKVLLISFIILMTGYLLLTQVTSFTGVFLVYLLIAVGGSMFKPVIGATIAKTTDEETSSIGFGLFYMIVNIGAFIGPLVAAKMRALDWDYVFIVSSVIIAFNTLLLILFFKEPTTYTKGERLFSELKSIGLNIISVIKDWRFALFLLIIAGFWSVYFQLFYSLPVFIDQWMDTSIVYRSLENLSPSLAQSIGTTEGTINPEVLTNIDAFYIILFQVMISGFVMRFKPLKTMTSGILIMTIGIFFMFAFKNPMFLFFSILLFGIGEMSTSPKVSEYIGRIAPDGRVALYMGCSYLPLAIGNLVAGFLSGSLFERIADKTTLLKNYLDRHTEILQGASFSTNSSADFNKVAEKMSLTPDQLTHLLWQEEKPWRIGLIFAGIGIVAFLSLLLYDKFVTTKKVTEP